jgi:hypothetical protein
VQRVAVVEGMESLPRSAQLVIFHRGDSDDIERVVRLGLKRLVEERDRVLIPGVVLTEGGLDCGLTRGLKEAAPGSP